MNRKTLMIAGGGLAVVLLFLYLRSRQQAGQTQGAGGPADTTGTAQDQAASDYAQLAGMMQQLQAQEQGDIATLTGQLQDWQAATVKGHFKGLFPDMFKLIRKLEHELAKTMAGQRREAKELAKLRHELAHLKDRKHHHARDHVGNYGHHKKQGHYKRHHHTG